MRFPLHSSPHSSSLALSLLSPPFPPIHGWPGVILEAGFPEQRNFFSVRNYYREFHGRMFVSRISFPLHRPVGHSTRVHSYSSVFQLLSESSSSLFLSLSLFRARFIISFQNSSSFEEEASFRCDWMEEIISSKISFILSNLKKRFVIPDRFLPIFPNCTTFRDTLRSELCTVKSEPRVLFHILNVSYYNSMKENYSRLIFRIRRRKFEV